MNRRDFLKLLGLAGGTIFLPNVFWNAYKYAWFIGDSELQGYPLDPYSRFTTRAYIMHEATGYCFCGTLDGGTHDAHNGWRTDELLEGIPVWAETIQVPELVIVNAGTNDVLQSTGYKLHDIMSTLRTLFPAARLVATRIFGPLDMHAQTVAYNNTQVDTLQDVDFVNLEGMPEEYYWTDRLHPNADGQAWMGLQYVSQLSLGSHV